MKLNDLIDKLIGISFTVDNPDVVVLDPTEEFDKMSSTWTNDYGFALVEATKAGQSNVVVAVVPRPDLIMGASDLKRSLL